MRSIKKRLWFTVFFILFSTIPTYFAGAIPTFYGGSFDQGLWTRLLKSNTNMFESGADFQHHPWEADDIERLSDHGFNINFRIFWWWKFYNGEIAWNTSIVDFYYNSTLMSLLEEYIDDQFTYVNPEKLWAVTLSEEEPRYAYRYFWTHENMKKYNHTYHSETGFWLKINYELNKTEELVLRDWLSRKFVWVFNHMYDYIKDRWPHLLIFQFISPWPGAPPVWVEGIDVSQLKADSLKTDLYYYDVYNNPFWLYEYVRQSKSTFPDKEHHIWLWGEEPWTKGGLSGGFEHIRRNAWIAYLAGVDAIGWFNWHYIHGNIWGRDDALGKRLFLYTNRLNEELSKLPRMKPRPQVLIIRDEMMSFQLGLCCELGLFNEWDVVNQRTFESKNVELSQYSLILVNEDKYGDNVVEKLNNYVRSGGNLILLGGFGQGQRNFYDNSTRTTRFLIEEGVKQEEVGGNTLIKITRPNILDLEIKYESIDSKILGILKDNLTENHHSIGKFYRIKDGGKLSELDICPLVLYHNASNPDEGWILYWGGLISHTNPDEEYDDVVEAFADELKFTRYLYRTFSKAFIKNILNLYGSASTTQTENMIITQSKNEDGSILAGISNYHPEDVSFEYLLDLDRFGLSNGKYWIHSLDKNLTLGWFESQNSLLKVPISVDSSDTRLLIISQDAAKPSFSVDIFPDIPTEEEVESFWSLTLNVYSEYGSIEGVGTYGKGETAKFSVSPTTITINPGVKHIFTGWLSDSPEGYNGSKNPAQVIINNDIKEIAQWKTQYYLTMETGRGGSVSPSSGWQDAGTELVISAKPDSGFVFSSWLGNGAGSYSGTSDTKTIKINGPITETPIFIDVAKPIAKAGYDMTVQLGESIVFDASGSSDNVGIIKFEWDFGDGNTATGPYVIHTYTEPGNKIVNLYAEDAVGNSAKDTIIVIVQEDKPEPVWNLNIPPWVLFIIILAIPLSILPYLFTRGTS